MNRFAVSLLAALLLTGVAFALTDDEIRLAYEKSYYFEKLQDYENSIKALSQVYEAYPGSYTVNLRLGWLYYCRQNYGNSLYYYQCAIKAAPGSVEARLGSILPLLAQKRYDQVVSAAYQVINTDYYNYYANSYLAHSLRMQKKYDLAEKVCTTMLELYPTDVSFLTELALARAGQGKKDGARSIFQAVLVLDPENTTAKSWLKR